jgi:hypothetical protein
MATRASPSKISLGAPIFNSFSPLPSRSYCAAIQSLPLKHGDFTFHKMQAAC